MKRILTLAALAAVLWVGVAFAWQDRLVSDDVVVTRGYKKLSVWFPIESQPQGALAIIYTGDAETAAGDTLRLFFKASRSDTADGGWQGVISKDVIHSNVATGTAGAAIFDTMCVKMVPIANGPVNGASKWVLPLPVFVYPGQYISIWGARDSTASSSATISVRHVGTDIR